MENIKEAENKPSFTFFSKRMMNVLLLKAIFLYISTDCNVLEIVKASKLL